MAEEKKDFVHKRVTLALVNHKASSGVGKRLGAQSFAIKPVEAGEPGLPFATEADVKEVAKRLAIACQRHKIPTNALWLPAMEGEARHGPTDFEACAAFLTASLAKGSKFAAGRHGNSIVIGGKAKQSADVEARIAEFLK